MHRAKMRHDSIEKPVQEELESQEKDKSYPCATHGAKRPCWNWERESCHSFDDGEPNSGWDLEQRENHEKDAVCLD
jgi:hypothetical protein